MKAVGFTGSLSAGKALMDRAAARPEPIPCFMEMSSVNPVFVLPEALRTRGAQIASGLVGSFTLGVGQFCTKPGLVFLPRNADADKLVAELKPHVEKAAIRRCYRGNLEELWRGAARGQKRQSLGWRRSRRAESNGTKNSYADPVVMQISAGDLLREPELATEVFGPSTLVIRYESRRS